MNKYIIPNLHNACRTLKLLAQEEGGLTLNEMSKRLTIPRTTMLRILTTLKGENMLALNAKKYTLGNALIHLGARTLEGINVRSVSLPILKELATGTGETAHLAVLSGHNSLLVEVCDSPNPVRVASRAGTLTHLHCSSTGKIFLAYKIEDLEEFFEGKELVQRTDKTMTTVEEIAAEAQRTLSRGYSLDDEEYNMGVRCLAAPIRDVFGEVVAAIGITAGTSTFTKKRIPDVSRLVVDAADRISGILGENREAKI